MQHVSLTEPLSQTQLVLDSDRLLLASAQETGALEEALGTLSTRYLSLRHRGFRWLVRAVATLALTAAVLVVVRSVTNSYRQLTQQTDQLSQGVESGLDLNALDIDNLEVPAPHELGLKRKRRRGP